MTGERKTACDRLPLNGGFSGLEIQAPSIGERYRDFTLIGAGGVSVVFKAFDSSLKKTVTVKVLKMRDFSNQTAMRFQQEAKAANRLNHLNIVKVLDFGVTAENQLYLVMDYIEGRDLQRLINDTGGISKPKALYISRQIASAMAHAHNQGVIHRDLKPSNVMLLNPDDDEPEVRVVDFGLAKVQNEENSDARLTKTGLAVGSPFYMSPEQIRGRDVDARADIYSLGCVMFEMLSGNPPFMGDTPLKTFEGHLRKAPPDLRDCAPQVNGLLANMVDKMLSKPPEERFQSMEQLLDEMVTREHALIAEPTDQEPSLYSANRRNPLIPILLLTMVGFLVMTSLAWYISTQNPARHRRHNLTKVKSEFLDADYHRNFIQSERHKEIVYACINHDANDDTLKELKGKTLANIDLSNTSITGSGLKYINNGKLRVLHLAHTLVDDSTLHYIAPLKSVEELDISYLPITNNGLKALAPMNQLIELNLTHCKEIDDGAIEIVAKQFPLLRYLDVSSTSISLKALERTNNLKDFFKLGYSDNDVTDEQLKGFLPLKKVTKIQLCGNAKLTDESFKIFSQMDGLARVELMDCPKITQKAVDAYLAKYPARQVEWNGTHVKIKPVDATYMLQLNPQVDPK